jgi:hypothetical protein
MTATIATPTITADRLVSIVFDLSAWLLRPDTTLSAEVESILRDHGVSGLDGDQIEGLTAGFYALMYGPRLKDLEADVAQLLWDNGVGIEPAEDMALVPQQ